VPTYEYECSDCGHRFEEFQSITDPPLSKCPRCGGKLNRLLGRGAAILFRGSGFHATDYRSEDYKRKAKEEGEPSKKEDTTPSKKGTDSPKGPEE
jgi:putative FmdB family regulatory protein